MVPFEKNWPTERDAALRWAKACAETDGLPSGEGDDAFLGGRNQLQDLCTGNLAASLTQFVRNSESAGSDFERLQSRQLGYPVALEHQPADMNGLSGLLARCEALREEFVGDGVGWELSFVVEPDVSRGLCSRLAELGIAFDVSARRRIAGASAIMAVSCNLLLDGYPTRLVSQSVLTFRQLSDEQLRELAALRSGQAIEQTTIEAEAESETCLRPFDPSGLELAEQSRRGLVGHWRCDHERGFWAPVGGTGAALGCHACGCERLVVVPRHRLPADHPLAPPEDGAYPARRRALAILAQDPAVIPDSVEQMRRADGVVSVDPASYAIGRRSRQVGAGRRVDEITPRRRARA